MPRLRLLPVVLAVLVMVGWSLGNNQKVDDQKEPPPKLKGQLPQNWKKLGLTDDQVQKVYKVQADYDAKVNDLQEKIKKLRQEEKTDLMKILTEAQKARLKEINEGKVP